MRGSQLNRGSFEFLDRKNYIATHTEKWKPHFRTSRACLFAAKNKALISLSFKLIVFQEFYPSPSQARVTSFFNFSSEQNTSLTRRRVF